MGFQEQAKAAAEQAATKARATAEQAATKTKEEVEGVQTKRALPLTRRSWRGAAVRFTFFG